MGIHQRKRHRTNNRKREDVFCHPGLRSTCSLFATLLAEVQRIKSEGDYRAGKALVEQYAIKIDQPLHKEVLKRYAALELKPYGGFINPNMVPVYDKNGKLTDVLLEYADDFLQQQLSYGKAYAFL